MKFVYPDIDCVFDTEIDNINTLIIENQSLFISLIEDLQNQIAGLGGKAVLSSGDKLLPLNKNLELLDRFVPFDMNGKSLISKITADLEKKAVSDEYCQQSSELVGRMDAFLAGLAFDYNCDIRYSKINIGSFIKAAGVEICDDYDSLGEKLIDYFQLVYEFIGRKIFITINLRSYMTDGESEQFMQTILSHGFHVIMIENCEHKRIEEEKRLIVDADYCVIG